MKPQTTIKTRSGEVMTVAPAGTISGTKLAPKDSRNLADVEITKSLVNPSRIDMPALKKTRKSSKGRKKTSDYIDYDKAMLKGQELLWNNKSTLIGFYIIFSINTGLRVSDILNMRHSDLVNLRPGDYLTITEHKTKKVRKIQVNEKIFEAYRYVSGILQERGAYREQDFIFKSQKNMTYATVSINRILKTVFAGYCRNISTHSLRKSFGRRVYEANNRSEHALILLSDIFQHSNTAITRRYLGLRQEEIDNVYLSL